MRLFQDEVLSVEQFLDMMGLAILPEGLDETTRDSSSTSSRTSWKLPWLSAEKSLDSVGLMVWKEVLINPQGVLHAEASLPMP